MAFVPWPSWLKYQRSENTKKQKKKRRNHWLGVVHCLPTRWPVLSILFFITIIEARLHRVSFETCSPQTPDPIIENDLQGHIYRFCSYNFVEFGTLLHYQERTARIVLYLRRSQGNVKNSRWQWRCWVTWNSMSRWCLVEWVLSRCSPPGKVMRRLNFAAHTQQQFL